MMPTHTTRFKRAQRGQSLVEMLVVASAVLVVGFLALNMLGHLSDARDRMLSASRYAAWERTVYFDDTNWAPAYGNAITKSDARIRSEIAQRVFGHKTNITGADGSKNALAASSDPMWRDIKNKDLLQQYDDLQVSHTSGSTGTGADTLVSALGSVSGIGAGFALPVKNQQSASVALRLGYNNPTLSAMWPTWQGVTFSDHNALLTNAWTPDGSDKAKAMIADAVPTAKGALAEYALDALALYGPEITDLDPGRIEPDVVPKDRTGRK
jgi:hypothetical protein